MNEHLHATKKVELDISSWMIGHLLVELRGLRYRELREARKSLERSAEVGGEDRTFHAHTTTIKLENYADLDAFVTQLEALSDFPTPRPVT